MTGKKTAFVASASKIFCEKHMTLRLPLLGFQFDCTCLGVSPIELIQIAFKIICIALHCTSSVYTYIVKGLTSILEINHGLILKVNYFGRLVSVI